MYNTHDIYPTMMCSSVWTSGVEAVSVPGLGDLVLASCSLVSTDEIAIQDSPLLDARRVFHFVRPVKLG